MFTYELNIYTYPPMRGVPCGWRESSHNTPAEAISHLESQILPYAYAALVRRDGPSVSACDWNGEPVGPKQRCPVRRGTNGENPIYLEIMAAWPDLIAQVRQIYTETREAMIDIAGRILHERWPQAMLSEKLAWDAADPKWRDPSVI